MIEIMLLVYHNLMTFQVEGLDFYYLHHFFF